MEVYSRVVGYFRPVQTWNKGKQEEFGERVPFRSPEALPSKKEVEDGSQGVCCSGDAPTGEILSAQPGPEANVDLGVLSDQAQVKKTEPKI